MQPSDYILAITCYSASGTLIMQLPREKRRTLFIFPVFLSAVFGFSLFAFEASRIGFWPAAAWAGLPALIVLIGGRVVPPWLLILLSYTALLAGLIFGDLALHQGHIG